MITRGTGNLLMADVDALVNTVNTVGVMGKGIALQFKRAYPTNFEDYKAACDLGEVQVGRMHVHELNQVSGPRFVINFPTKRHWRSPSKIDDITSGLITLRDEIVKRGIKSIAVPPLGCGNGGLDWRDVGPLIEQTLGTIPGVEVRIWEPSGSPNPKAMPNAAVRPPLNRERASFLAALGRYVQSGIANGLAIEPRVSLLEAHKVAYFLQKLGLPLGLKFEKGTYGPYSQPLDRAVSVMEGHFVTGFGDGTSGAQALLELDKEAVEEAEKFVLRSTEFEVVSRRFQKLISGFEDPFGMELLSTVLFASEELVDPPVTLEKIVECTQGWNDRKHRLFTNAHVATAWERIKDVGLHAI
ncbi:O-acetyl-ADP-ribose deacetylase (regulator of RNase III), contains Macro domain [Actinacidiphila yanglinensis]|uniref:O-acetyl-ADP-ribose deacetylase (Regulator of RNase III), contains Macro domain n=1 Tax=Actinacidiphila yanglinensis TaxID=310779 RepID=A0A1H6ACM0_9ACTN|nr:macro domain-containing protein [Actinacidiphila yanglinensis]SEG46221.1 O-acetyl-ADP-ribose deacetylase (regulator of RNase III), contains Macro domain [Actinacidiphila yanglinensis]